MKDSLRRLKLWILPKTDKDIDMEIDIHNLSNIYHFSIVVGIVQIISIIFFAIFKFNTMSQSDYLGAMLRVGLSVVLCVIGFFISRLVLNNRALIEKHRHKVKFFIGGFITLLILWGMYASIPSYVNHQQILAFYTVELLAVLFVKLTPLFTVIIIFGSYLAYFLILNFCFEPGLINPYNYLMLAILSVVGAMINYRMMVNYIKEKNKAIGLNKSLELIANHDSTTRLQNRYALNQCVNDYVGKDICVAMGDINSFKAVNDTYGHPAGDDVLKRFSEILLRFFKDEEIYRYGGDEFLIVVSGNDIETFEEKFKKINECFASVRIAGIERNLGCSFGCVTACPADVSEFFGMLIHADRKLYTEKERVKAGR
ncbi:MAG: GGDEF domain-containing protein [Ruminococcus sp.]|nr:GGDEF domain-containing protein [Ruminococcus sp.]